VAQSANNRGSCYNSCIDDIDIYPELERSLGAAECDISLAVGDGHFDIAVDAAPVWQVALTFRLQTHTIIIIIIIMLVVIQST